MSENDLIGNLTVSEFRKLMQQCFDCDRAEQTKRKTKEASITHLVRQGMGYQEAIDKVNKDWGDVHG